MGITSEEEDDLFDEKLLDYEIFFGDFILDIAREKRANLKIANITTHLFIHEGLTQEELRNLSANIYKRTKNKNRKMSIGTISTYLSVLMGLGVKKERIPGTHKYKYFFPGKIEKIADIGLDRAFESFFKLETFLNEKKRQLNELVKDSKNGAKELIKRIDELIEAFEYYRILFKTIESGGKQ